MTVGSSTPLPASMWTPPDTILEESMRLLYSDLVRQVREEFSSIPGFGTLESMLIERVCFEYVSMRDDELRGAPSSSTPTATNTRRKNHLEHVKLWTGLAAQLQRSVADAIDRDKAIAAVYNTVAGALADAVEHATVDTETAEEIRLALAASLSK